MDEILGLLLGLVVAAVTFGVPAYCGAIAERRGHSLALWGFTAFACIVVGWAISIATHSLWGFVVVPIVPAATRFIPDRTGEPDTIEEPETVSTDKWWM